MTGPGVIVLVGHCWPDRLGLRSAVRRALPGVRIARANNMRTLAGHLGSGAILLVNRKLDGRFDTRNGIELIHRLAAGGEKAILVSNLSEAQADAVAAGALPGFGKSQLHDAATLDALRGAVGVT